MNEIVISSSLYQKYNLKQIEAHNELEKLSKRYKEKQELFNKSKSGNDQAVLIKQIEEIKINIAINQAVSKTLRMFLLEIMRGGI